MDEFGGIEGVVTLINILETLVGDIPTSEEMAEPPIVQRDDGSYLVDGMVCNQRLKPFLGIETFPAETTYNDVGRIHRDDDRTDADGRRVVPVGRVSV